jgi:Protein of unknown function (DUF1569)
MALPNIFTAPVAAEIIGRINRLSANTQPNWGKMSVAQMLAHCCVTYEMAFEDKHPKPNFFVGFMLKTFLKSTVVSEKPYSQNGGTAPQFVIKETKDFEVEKARLIGFIEKTQQLGENHFDGKESHSFGNLNKTEWNNMFYKHLNHHLTQFGV